MEVLQISFAKRIVDFEKFTARGSRPYRQVLLFMSRCGSTKQNSPFLYLPGGKNQLDPVDVEKTRKIANIRIHVERVTEILREKFTVLQSTLSIPHVRGQEQSQTD